jgi:hypothetical protein
MDEETIAFLCSVYAFHMENTQCMFKNKSNIHLLPIKCNIMAVI